MKKLLLITGDLACGKTTFAHILSMRYGACAFCKDSIKEVLGDTIGFANREENRRLSGASIALMGHIFSEFARLGRDLILEANFHSAELEELHSLAQEYGYAVRTLVLYGDVELLHARYLNRMRNENRHTVHLSTTFDVFDDFCAYTQNLRKERIPGEVQIINADDFAYQAAPEVLEGIDGFFMGD